MNKLAALAACLVLASCATQDNVSRSTDTTTSDSNTDSRAQETSEHGEEPARIAQVPDALFPETSPQRVPMVDTHPSDSAFLPGSSRSDTGTASELPAPQFPEPHTGPDSASETAPDARSSSDSQTDADTTPDTVPDPSRAPKSEPESDEPTESQPQTPLPAPKLPVEEESGDVETPERVSQQTTDDPQEPDVPEQVSERSEPPPSEPEAEPEPESDPEPEPDPEPGPVDTESREVEARHNVTVGDEVELNLPGTGWIYLGEENDAEGLSFRRRRTSSGNTVFLFSADEAGEYVARFQRQDLDTGAFDQQRVAVEAAPEPSAGGGNDAAPPGAVDDAAAGDAGAGGDAGAEIGRSNPTVEDLADPEAESDGDFAPDVTGEEQGQGEQEDDGEDDQGDVDEAAEEEPVDVDEAYALLEAGDREAALETFLDGDPGDDPEVHDTIAELAYELEEYGTARRHWQRNLDGEDSSYRRAARDGLFRTALATEDTEGAWEHYSALTDAGDEPEAEQALELGLLLLESSEAARAIEPLEQYLAEEGDDSPQPTQSATDTESGTPEADRAEIYFRLAELYESEREARSALEYYERVVDEYPLSKYWEPAEARVQYLRRHFFDIR